MDADPRQRLANKDSNFFRVGAHCSGLWSLYFVRMTRLAPELDSWSPKPHS